MHLIDGPYVVVRGQRRELPEGSRHLIVLVALHGGPVHRRVAAGTLWPVGDDVRAGGNLRSALWRLRGAGIDLIEADQDYLRMREGTVVDVRVVSDWAARLIEGRPRDDDLRTAAWRCCSGELLPGWHEEWVVFQRERLRQRSLHGLEALSRLLVRAGRWTEAVEVAGTTVAVDPLRETAQRVLVEALLAAGDVPAARRCFEAYRSILAGELGLRPGRDLAALVGAHTERAEPAGRGLVPPPPGPGGTTALGVRRPDRAPREVRSTVQVLERWETWQLTRGRD
ncbi:AfsR/SARP family transcriptional regulator [Geodermatophilus sp. SYSU D01176]